MKNIRITALTEKGERSIQDGLDRRSKLPPQTRMTLRAISKNTVTQNPLSLLIEIRSLYRNTFDSDNFRYTLNTEMHRDGCVEDVDYKIEVQ